MIYLITGVPGSGKSLYAVSTLVQKLAAETITLKDGTIKKRRVVVDGIPGLLLPHEPMVPAVEDEKGNLSCDGHGVTNWFEWCVPGDVIVLDEVQRYWRPRGMGTKPPEMIKQLETHRHMGVDFVIITQNPMLIDQNVRRLVGRHIHVRRLFGLGRAVLYDWDGCSVDVHRTKTATVSYWSYPKSAYKLYKSSELHTKQKQKIPAWLIVPVLAIVGAFFVAPKAFSALSGAASGKGVMSAPSPVAEKVVVAPAVPVSAAAGRALPASAPDVAVSSVNAATDANVFAGCIANKKGCKCFDATGKGVDQDDDVCEALSVPVRSLLSSELPDGPPVAKIASSADLDVWEWMSRRR